MLIYVWFLNNAKIYKKQAKLVAHLFSKHAQYQRYDKENHTKLSTAQ